MKKKIKVSFGIPAYNEEKNIANLIKDILEEKEKSWSLKEIIMVDDASTDGTVSKVKSFKMQPIKIISHKKRRGKTTGFNEMLKTFKGDLLIQLDADERLGGKLVVEKIVKEFERYPNVMLVSGNKRPVSPHSFLQRGLYSTYKVFRQSKLSINEGNNIFGCQGGCIAIRKEFAKRIYIKNVISEDAYLYLVCKKLGFEFKYVDDANVYYKLANNLSDYLSQFFRSTPESVNLILKKYFGDMTKEEFHRPMIFYLSAIIGVLLDDPLPTFYVIMIYLLAKPFIPLMARRYKDYWSVAKSTK